MPRFVPTFLKSSPQQESSQNQQQESPFQQKHSSEMGESRFGGGRFGRQASFEPTPVDVIESVKEQPSRFGGGGVVNKNKFEALGEQSVSLSFPPVEPKPVMKPATMAELTNQANLQKQQEQEQEAGFTTVGGNKKKKTFGAKYADKMDGGSQEKKIGLGLPPIHLPKVDSFDDFPSLGGTPRSVASPKKTPTATSALSDMSSSGSPVPIGIKQSVSSSSFASLAKGWAKKNEEDELAAELEKQRTEKERLEEEAFRNNIRVFRKVIKKNEVVFDDDDEPRYDDEGEFEDEEDYEVPSGGEEELEPSDLEDDEYDPNYEKNPEKEYEERY